MILKPEISIIICTFSRAEMLRNTLMALTALERIEQAEVIVVDNHSLDHTPSVVEEIQQCYAGSMNIRYVVEQKQGLSYARNKGVSVSEAERIAFLDDDAIPVRTWITAILKSFDQYKEAYAFGGPITPRFEGGSKPVWLIGHLETPYTIIHLGENDRMYPAHLYPFGANMAFHKSVFSHVSFPEKLGRKGNMLLSGEEEWLFAKMRKRKMSFFYIPGMKVEHFIPASRLNKQWIRDRYYYQGKSKAISCHTGAEKWKLCFMTLLKTMYITVDFIFSRSEGRRLLNRCRMDSVRGTVESLLHD